MKIRISAGFYRSRNIDVPDDRDDLRPSKSIVREAALNMLAARLDLQECKALDLFCGCGALGLEALSQGVAHVSFVDTDIRPTRHNVELLAVPDERFALSQSDALRYTPAEAADIILADPPYGENAIEKLLKRKDVLGKSGSLWVLDAERSLKLEPENFGFTLLKQKPFGKSVLWLLEQN